MHFLYSSLILTCLIKKLFLKEMTIKVSYETYWPRERYTPMFSSSGVLYGNYTSIVSNMLKQSDITQTFLQKADSNSDATAKLT